MKLIGLITVMLTLAVVGCGGGSSGPWLHVMTLEVRDNNGSPTFTNSSGTVFDAQSLRVVVREGISNGADITLSFVPVDHSRKWFVKRDRNELLYIVNDVVTRIQHDNVQNYVNGSGLPIEEKDSLLASNIAFW
ncbi:MAG: hypothetical protein AAB669_02685 [Patescibacteria group bacterium]